MHLLSSAELEAQMLLELPERQLMDALINISGNTLDVSVLENIANHSFNNWSIYVLDFNHVTINVTGNVSQNDLDVFCNQIVAIASAQCNAQLV